MDHLYSATFRFWNDMISMEIHDFCDASQQALAAVLLIWSTEQENEVQTVIVWSKANVAPLKWLTVTRLELLANVLLVKLFRHITQLPNTDECPVHLCTNSAIVYTWINNHISRYTEFVHNRVCFIQEPYPIVKWHIPGKESLANCTTRGLTSTQLSPHRIWFTGSDWLQEPPSSWPNKFEAPSMEVNLEESPVKAIAVTASPSSTYWSLFDKYFSLTRILCITALYKRFILLLRKKGK